MNATTQQSLQERTMRMLCAKKDLKSKESVQKVWNFSYSQTKDLLPTRIETRGGVVSAGAAERSPAPNRTGKI